MSASKRKNRLFSILRWFAVFGYIIFMAWVVYWKMNYKPDVVYLPMDKWWENPGESANKTLRLLEAFK